MTDCGYVGFYREKESYLGCVINRQKYPFYARDMLAFTRNEGEIFILDPVSMSHDSYTDNCS
jgi:hypothetical protein